MTDRFSECIQACYTCAAACDHCSTACLHEPEPGKMVDCIRTDLDCGDFCRLAATAMARGSDSAAAICALCADICAKCADECEKHEHDHCIKCAKACRACAVQCHKMAA